MTTGSATIEAITAWKALHALGYEVGPLTSVVTLPLKLAMTTWATERGVRVGVLGVEPSRGFTLSTRDAVAELRAQAARYIEDRDPVEIDVRPRRTAVTPETSSPLVEAPFFRSNNPAAWALFLIPIAVGLGYAGWRFTRTTRRSRRG